MQPVRILVVDDAVVARRVISDILDAEDDFEVVGTAPNGNLALTKIARLHPDVVTLDIDMPELDGMQTLSAIRSGYPEIRVIMVSNHTQRGAAITVEALFCGASDYVTKAARTSSAEEARLYLQEQLVPKVRALAPPAATAAAAARAQAAQPISRRRPPAIEIVVIGSSTGGPNALDHDPRVAAGGLPGSSADRPAPAGELHNLSRQTSRLRIRAVGARGRQSDPDRARQRVDRAGQPPPRDQVDHAAESNSRPPTVRWSTPASPPRTSSFDRLRSASERPYSPSY